MFEIELKFQIADEKIETLAKAFQRKNTEIKQLQAKYYDTVQFELYKQSISLRQRLENEDWYQTLKLPTEQNLKRIEFEENLGSIEKPLQCDQYLKYKQIPKKIKSLLSQKDQPFTVQFQTQIERKFTLFKFQNSEIEVSYDQGKLYTAQQFLNIHELEFELKHGNVQDLISFILPRVKRYGLWLDTRSKAQRGFQLAQNIQENPVQFQTQLHLDQKDHPEVALQKIFNNCLQHLLPNSSAIASGNFNSQHVHQARVAIRRLRSALKTFSNWSIHIDPTWQTQLAEVFRQLGVTRDLNMIREDILPQLDAVHAPQFTLPENAEKQPQKLIALFRSFNYNYLILSLIQFIHQDPSEKSKNSICKTALAKTQKLHQKIQSDAENYLNLDIEAQHQTRKNLKRLRYSVEFISSLCNKKELKHYIQAMKPAQKKLGLYNDLIVAEELLANLVVTEPKVWFALGWITAEKNRALIESQRALLNFSKVKPLHQ